MIEQSFFDRYTNIIESGGLTIYSPVDFVNIYGRFSTGLKVTVGGWYDSFISNDNSPFAYTKISESDTALNNSFYCSSSDIDALNDNMDLLKDTFDKLQRLLSLFKNDSVGRTAANVSDYTDSSMIPPLIISPYFSITEEEREINPFSEVVFCVPVSPVIPSGEIGLKYYEIETPCFVKIFNNVPYLFYIATNFYFVGRSSSGGNLPCGRIGVSFKAYYKIVNS